MIIHVGQFDLSVEFELFTCQDEGDNIIDYVDYKLKHYNH